MTDDMPGKVAVQPGEICPVCGQLAMCMKLSGEGLDLLQGLIAAMRTDAAEKGKEFGLKQGRR
jgi:hypothetical protein